MNQIINSPIKITEKTGWTVFLAGPMKASPRGWRNKLVKPEDKVFVTGEFGGMDWRKLLNGDIIIADSLPDNVISVISLL